MRDAIVACASDIIEGQGEDHAISESLEIIAVQHFTAAARGSAGDVQGQGSLSRPSLLVHRDDFRGQSQISKYE